MSMCYETEIGDLNTLDELFQLVLVEMFVFIIRQYSVVWHCHVKCMSYIK